MLRDPRSLRPPGFDGNVSVEYCYTVTNTAAAAETVLAFKRCPVGKISSYANGGKFCLDLLLSASSLR